MFTLSEVGHVFIVKFHEGALSIFKFTAPFSTGHEDLFFLFLTETLGLTNLKIDKEDTYKSDTSVKEECT